MMVPAHAGPALAPMAAPVPAPVAAPPAPTGFTVKSPMVGTFYRSSSPTTSSFVDIGSKVAEGDTLCIIEAMKLMNEIESEVAGKVAEVLAQNGQPVEFGQPLFRIEPA
jgi:acetyl-CoA carboxylase biotin carboxyl carrier protein